MCVMDGVQRFFSRSGGVDLVLSAGKRSGRSPPVARSRTNSTEFFLSLKITAMTPFSRSQPTPDWHCCCRYRRVVVLLHIRQKGLFLVQVDSCSFVSNFRWQIRVPASGKAPASHGWEL